MPPPIWRKRRQIEPDEVHVLEIVKNMLFGDWTGLLRVALIGTAAYFVLVILLRASGKRTLSKMNAFDFVVTIALGSTLATVLLDRSVPLLEGALAFATLIYLQFLITWLSVRWPLVRSLVKSEPTLLVYEGEYLESAMRGERVTREEIEAALRERGVADASGVRCVVLETDGTLSVVSE